MSEEDQTNKAADSERNSAPDRSSERSSERGERELSGGRRDRSREMLREEIARNFDNENSPHRWQAARLGARWAARARGKRGRGREAKNREQRARYLGHSAWYQCSRDRHVCAAFCLDLCRQERVGALATGGAGRCGKEGN